MVRHRSQLTSRRILEDWPHHVVTPQPDAGFGRRLDAMFLFLTGRDYKTTSRRDPCQREEVVWCFKSQIDAQEFRAWYEAKYAKQLELEDILHGLEKLSKRASSLDLASKITPIAEEIRGILRELRPGEAEGVRYPSPASTPGRDWLPP